jgi:SAM-dependent methyltransferase
MNQVTPQACPLCGQGQPRLHYRENGFAYWRCLGCGLLFLWPRPTAEFLARHYQDYLDVDPDAAAAWGRDMAPVIAAAAESLEAKLPGRGRVLDIGCGYGFFLDAMRCRGFDGEGVELSRPAAAYATHLTGLPIHSCAFEDAPLSGPFDAITLFYVIEHVPDPVATLRAVAELLRPGGILYLRYPNTTPLLGLPPLARRLGLMQAPSHLHDFAGSSLDLLLTQAGLRPLCTTIAAGTSSDNPWRRAISRASGTLGAWLAKASQGKILVPGVSRVTLATLINPTALATLATLGGGKATPNDSEARHRQAVATDEF